MHPHIHNPTLVKEDPLMVALPIEERSILELNARTLAATALTEAGIPRTDAAMAYLTSQIIDHAALCAAAWKTANAGDEISAAKLTLQANQFAKDPPGT